jgi:ribosomal protein RSM22 (predicted rRNA methylase)
LKNRLPSFKPKTCLDYGSGLGSGVFAAMHMYGSTVEDELAMQRVAAVEPNVNMRKLGKYLTKD